MVKKNWDERTYTEGREEKNKMKQGSKLYFITKYAGSILQI